MSGPRPTETQLAALRAASLARSAQTHCSKCGAQLDAKRRCRPCRVRAQQRYCTATLICKVCNEPRTVQVSMKSAPPEVCAACQRKRARPSVMGKNR